jgi:hypothetical protein
MTWWQRLRLRNKLEEQLEKEVRFHLDQHIADLIGQGHNPAEARRHARLALGGPEQVKEDCRDARGTRWLEDLWQDFRHAARTLRQRPAFTAVGALTLALGIGASTAIFSAVNPILFEPLPYPHASRIVMIWDTFHGMRPGWRHLEGWPGITNRKPARRTPVGYAAWAKTAEAKAVFMPGATTLPQSARERVAPGSRHYRLQLSITSSKSIWEMATAPSRIRSPTPGSSAARAVQRRTIAFPHRRGGL